MVAGVQHGRCRRVGVDASVAMPNRDDCRRRSISRIAGLGDARAVEATTRRSSSISCKRNSTPCAVRHDVEVVRDGRVQAPSTPCAARRSRWGSCVRFAPALRSFASVDSCDERATMNRSGLSARAVTVTNRFSASVSRVPSRGCPPARFPPAEAPPPQSRRPGRRASPLRAPLCDSVVECRRRRTARRSSASVRATTDPTRPMPATTV